MFTAGRDLARLTGRPASRLCLVAHLDWRSAADRLGSFVLWLRHTPSFGGRPGASVVLAGPGADEVRGPRRINAVLAAVRGFLAFAVDQGEAPQGVMRQLYELADSRSLPAEARGEDGAWRLRMRARHHVQVPKTRVSRASDEEAVALLRACRSARDRLLVLVLCRAGLRRSEAVGLRREDIHFLPDSSGLGCDFPGSHLHVVRRDNVNGAWAKSRHSRSVPVDRLVVQAHDQYVLERAEVPDAVRSDFVFVNLFRPPVGAPMKPGAVNDLFVALQEEIRRVKDLIHRVKQHLDDLTDDERAEIEQASAAVRRTRQLASLGMPRVRAAQPDLRLERP